MFGGMRGREPEEDDASSTAVVGDDSGHATVVDRPGARGRTPASVSIAAPITRTSAGTATATTVGSPLEALARDETIRTRKFCYVGFVIALGAAGSLLFLPGRGTSTFVFLAGIVTACLSLGYLLHRTRNPATFHQGIGVSIGWFIPAVSCASAVPYFGPSSPVAIILVLGIYFTGLGASNALATSIYVTVAVVQGLTGGLVIAGVIAEPGFIRADYLPVEVQITCQALIQLVLGATLVIARVSRSATLRAIGELEVAVRAVAQREALLQEAREELRRALGGGRGRFSEQMIGPYRLGEVIGRGAMGEVYDGLDTRTDQPVAVKMLSQTSLGNAQHVQRFLRELRTASSIESPHVVRVLDIGEEPLPHLVMERLRGRDLAAILRDRRALSHPQVIDLIRQVGAGITAASAAGIIHRDLKPQNVFLVGTTWKVLDFGVARAADSGDTLTSGQVIGTPSYMAPEQASGRELDHRADLYALAAIAYRVLTGHAPFAGREIAEVLYHVVHAAPRRPTSLANLPADVDVVLSIGLAKRPADRFSTAAELADALASALGGSLSDALRARGRALVPHAWA
ncbi:MAG: serine/threonine protein kinase [Deltaproteobacteria bacterium]|nr:serine/threonine protein kinase [Deltaproteobacteria bacterium]